MGVLARQGIRKAYNNCQMKTKKKLLNILFLLVVIMTSVVLLFISINNGFSNGSVSHAQTLFWGYLAIFGGGVLTLGILESASENPCHDAGN